MIPLLGGDDSSKLHLARMDGICHELTVEIKFY